MSEQNDIQAQQKRLDTIDQQEDQEVLVGEKKYGEVVFGKVDNLKRKIDTDAGITDERVKALPAFQKLKQDALKKTGDELRGIDEKNIDVATKKLEETLRQLEIKFEKMKELTPLLNTLEKFQKMFGTLPFLRDWMTLYTVIDPTKRASPETMIRDMEKLMSIGGGYSPSGEMVKHMEPDVLNLMGAYLREDRGVADITLGVLGERLAFARRVTEKLPQIKEERKKIEGAIKEYESHNEELRRNITSGRPLDLLKGLERSYLHALALMPACKSMTKWGPDLLMGVGGRAPVNYEPLLPEEVRKELSFTTVVIDSQGKPKDMPAQIPLTDEAMKKTEDTLQGQLIMMRRGIYLTTKDPAYKGYFEASQVMMTGRLIDDALQYIAETGEENADIKKCIGIVAGNFDSVQRMQPENPVRAAGENSLFQKRIIALKKKLGAGGIDAHANTAGVLGNEMQFIGMGLMSFTGLKERSPKQHEAFVGILNTYLQQSRALSAQMLTQNPVVGEFQHRSVEAKQMFSGLATTFQNLSGKIEKSGEGFSETDMTGIKKEIVMFRSRASYKFLKSSQAMSTLQEMKKHMSDPSLIPPKDLAMIRQAEQSILQSQMALQQIDQTCEQLMAMDGYRTGAKGFAIDALKIIAKIAAAVAGAVVVGGVITASGGLGIVAAGTGFGEVILSSLATNALIAGGASVGGAMADSVMEQNMNALQKDALLQSWIQGTTMSIAGGAAGTLLGKGMGTLSAKSMQAMQGSRFAAIRGVGTNMEARALKQAVSAQAERHTSGNIFRNMLAETKEELLEEGLQNVGRAIAPDDPGLGFLFSLFGSAYGHGKGVEGMHAIRQDHARNNMKNVKNETNKIKPEYSQEEQALIDELSARNIPHDVRKMIIMSEENHFTGERLTTRESKIQYAEQFMKAHHTQLEYSGTTRDMQTNATKDMYRSVDATPEEAARNRMHMLRKRNELSIENATPELIKAKCVSIDDAIKSGSGAVGEEYMQSSRRIFTSVFPSLAQVEDGYMTRSQRMDVTDKINVMLPFFREHQISDVHIDPNHRLDLDNPGSSANVYMAKINGMTTEVVAKVYHVGDLQGIRYGLSEGIDLSIAEKVGIGPGFLGYHITENGQFVVLMGKAEGRPLNSLNSEATQLVTNETIESFNTQMDRLHRAGYTFAGDGGQIMIRPGGSISFIDIVLVPLKENGMAVDRPRIMDGGILISPEVLTPPRETESYKRILGRLKAIVAEKSAFSRFKDGYDDAAVKQMRSDSGIAYSGPAAAIDPIISGIKNMGLFKGLGQALNSILGNPSTVPQEKYDPMEDLYPGREKDLEMVQSSNVGDCYMIAAIYALKHNDVFAGLMRKIIQRNVNARGDEGWGVSFLGDKNGNNVVITPAELHGQKAFNQKTKKWEYRYPVKGGKGDIILERAFGRRRKEMKEEREREEREESQKRNPDGEMTFFAVVGGYGNEFLSFILGNCVSRSIDIGLEDAYKPFDMQHGRKKDVEEFLTEAALNPDHFIITANTPRHMVTPYKKTGNHREFGDGFKYFMDPEFFFYQKHAYAVVSIDSDKKELTVVNPHDTSSKRKTISWDTFMKIFSDVSAVQLNPDNVKSNLGLQLPAWKSPPAVIQEEDGDGDRRVVINLKDLSKKRRGDFSDDEDSAEKAIRIMVDWKSNIIHAIESSQEFNDAIRKDITFLSQRDMKVDISEIKRHCIEKRLTLKHNGSSTKEKFSRMKFYQDIVLFIENIEHEKGWVS